MAMHKMKYEIVCQCNSDGINKFPTEGKWVESAKCQRTIFACLALFVSQLEGVGGWKWKWSSDWLGKKMYGTEYCFCWGSSTEESLIHGPQLSNSHGWNNSQTVDMDKRMHFRSGCSDQKA